LVLFVVLKLFSYDCHAIFLYAALRIPCEWHLRSMLAAVMRPHYHNLITDNVIPYPLAPCGMSMFSQKRLKDAMVMARKLVLGR